MELQPVTSSNLQAIGYDPATRTLAVQFVSSGDIWHFADVPQESYDALMNPKPPKHGEPAPSLGSRFHHNIKSVFHGTKQD